MLALESVVSILALPENTEKTYRKISKIVRASISAINLVVRMKKETGSITPKRKGKCDCKMKTTARDDAYLIRERAKDPRKASDATKNYFGGKGIK